MLLWFYTLNMCCSSVFSRCMDSSPDRSVSFSELADTLLQIWHITNQPEHVYDTPFKTNLYVRLHVNFHRRHRMYTTFIKGQSRVKCNHKSEKLCRWLHSREKRFKVNQRGTSHFSPLDYRQLGSGNGQNKLIAIFHQWNKKMACKRVNTTVTVNWTFENMLEVFPKAKSPFATSSIHYTRVLQNVQAFCNLL